MKTWIARGALVIAVFLSAAACSPEELKAIWDSNGTDYSAKTEDDIKLEAFYWTIWATEQAPPAPQADQGGIDAYSGALSADQLGRLRACESGGDYGITGPGGYYGAYQFSQSTWDHVANAHYSGRYAGVRPTQVPAEWQDAFARALYAEQGRGPWPVCGLRI